MNRTDKIKLKRQKRISRIKTILKSIISIAVLMMILYTGLTIVDKTNRSVLMIDDTVFFEYNRVRKSKYKVTFCGDIYSFDTSKLEMVIVNTKDTINDGYRKLNAFIDEKDLEFIKIITNMDK